MDNTKDLNKTLYNYAISLLARKEYTAFELTQKLNQKLKRLQEPASSELVSQIISQVISSEYLSEKRFVHAFARSKIMQKIGPIKILYELSQKGLTEQKVNQYLEECEAWQDNNWVEQAIELLNKKFSGEKQAVIWPKKAQYLQSKGYTFEQIKQSIKTDATINE